MSFSSERSADDRRLLLFARVRDAAFDAVYSLWLARKAAGWTQKDLCDRMDRDASWVSRSLAGPGNWTMKTFGELADALDGEIDVTVTPREMIACNHNYDIYADICSNAEIDFEPIPANVSQSNGVVRVNFLSFDSPIESVPRVSTTASAHEE